MLIEFLLINSPHGPMKIFNRSGDVCNNNSNAILALYGIWQETSWNNWKIAQNIPLDRKIEFEC